MLPVCDGSSEIFSRKPITQTFYMAGMLVGSFVFGWLSDRIGRKSTMMLALIILAAGGSFPFFLTPTPDLYYALVISRWPDASLGPTPRFISGCGHVGLFMTTFSLALEYVGPSYRTLFGIIIETPFALGGVVVGLVSWAGVRRWQTLSLVLSAPNLVLLSYWWLVPESPRWLIGEPRPPPPQPGTRLRR